MVNPVLQELVTLSLKLGDPSSDLAILAEGNASARLDDDHFYVKASGYSMRNIEAEGFSLVLFAPILDALNGPDLSDVEVRELLSSSRADPDFYPRPSVETFMHAYLLGLPGVSVIGHTHPTPLISLLSIEGCEEIAGKRLFPDEVVCCGPATAFVPYTDPGLPLARAIKASVESFAAKFEMVPKTIWLQNHGLIALGRSVADVESATLMGIKSARAWLGALATGRTLIPLTQENISRIHTRPDEHYRQELLWAMKHKGA
jgi:rhamnose utilization protein RhaD (predicted bifunctional aldolase and dehydrogenase)